MRRAAPRRIGLALAGGGPFGAIYETGALLALQDAIEGLDLNALDCYVGVSAGSFLSAALANGIPASEIHGLFIEGRAGEGALTPEAFMRPAFGEYLRRARALPGLFARALWRYATPPYDAGALESFAPLGRAIPTGLFDNAAIHRYLARAFTRAGRSNDFRRLQRKLFLVATDLDSGESVSFGRSGYDHVPISRAVQASAALPGLFPPVEIDGRFYVDGALKKTLHASEALDEGMKLVLCVNPIVPYDASRAAERGATPHARLVEGGLPLVLSQTFRAVIHSRLTTGIAKYGTDYRDADVLLFQPEPDDSEVFFANLFGFAARGRLCEHAYRQTCADLARRAATIEPVLQRHGLRLRHDRLQARPTATGLEPRAGAPWGASGARMGRAAVELRHTMGALERWIARERG